MRIDEQGLITPVAITREGAPRDVLREYVEGHKFDADTYAYEGVTNARD